MDNKKEERKTWRFNIKNQDNYDSENKLVTKSDKKGEKQILDTKKIDYKYMKNKNEKEDDLNKSNKIQENYLDKNTKKESLGVRDKYRKNNLENEKEIIAITNIKLNEANALSDLNRINKNESQIKKQEIKIEEKDNKSKSLQKIEFKITD